MGTERTSNKDILEAVANQTASIDALVNVLTQNAQAQPATPVAETTQEPEDASSVNIDKRYREHMLAKVQAKCDSDGEDRILYARRNGNGEVKLAYRLASSWSTLRDNGLLGAIEHVKPESA